MYNDNVENFTKFCGLNYVSLYWYDAGGNRTVKEHGGGEAVWVNSAPAGQRTDTVAYTIYPSPYISVTGDRWTMHYYVGSERIASRTGTLSGGFASLNIGDNNSAGNGLEMTIDYGTMCSAEEDSIDSIYSHFGVPYEALHTNTRDGGWHLYLPVPHGEGGSDNTADTPDSAQDRNLPHLNGDSQVYFYHRDHLGSTMSVTDSLGATVQLVEYTPWGEVFVERRFESSGYESPYLFNGKELDEETGLYYYGARYYDPKLSVWYATDPMQMDYPWVSTYGYCLGNPIKFWDFFGYIPTDEEAAAIADDVYDPGKKKLPGNWFYLKYKPSNKDVVFNNDYTGFKSAVYGRWDEKTHQYTEYVYATAGTDLYSPFDWANNFMQLFGCSPQYAQSVFNARELTKEMKAKGKELSYVGHSLGGGEASANAMATGNSAITFNAAALSNETKRNLHLNHKEASITAIVVEGEILDYLQRNKLNMHAEGTIKYLKAWYLPPITPTFKEMRTLQRIYNHSIGTVRRKLKP